LKFEKIVSLLKKDKNIVHLLGRNWLGNTRIHSRSIFWGVSFLAIFFPVTCKPN